MAFKAHRISPRRRLLAESLRQQFGSKVRERGSQYYHQGCVRITDGSDVELNARVTGSREYSVNFRWSGPEEVLFANCDCPYASDGGFCKHLWATILAADSQGYLTVPAANRDLYMELNYDDYKDDDEDGGPEELKVFQQAPAPGFSIPVPPEPKLPSWQQKIRELSYSVAPSPAPSLRWSDRREILYLVDPTGHNTHSLTIRLLLRDKVEGDGYKSMSYITLRRDQIPQLPSAEDREILTLLAGVQHHNSWDYGGGSDRIPDTYGVPNYLMERVVTMAAQARRCYVQLDYQRQKISPVVWDPNGVWQFGLALRRHPKSGWELVGEFRRGDAQLKLEDVVLLTESGLLFTSELAARWADSSQYLTVLRLRNALPIRAPQKDLEAFLANVLTLPDLPSVEVPPELQFTEVRIQPRPHLHIRPGDEKSYWQKDKLQGELSFDYEGRRVLDQERSGGFYEAELRRFVRRDTEFESAAKQLLHQSGFRHRQPTYYDQQPPWQLAPSKLPKAVRMLVEAGWHIEAEGKVFRRPGAFKLEVSSGIDWFELHGAVDYGDTQARLPELLEALRRGETMIRLDDGTYGVLPEDWLKRIGVLAGLGTPAEGHVRFKPSQAGVLDALLMAETEARCDETFTRVRAELGQFQGVKAAPQPGGFVGRLRDYQREGLGWMQFLQRFAFGGCLADDMGVGKTAQVLALLELRRAERSAGGGVGPSLVVVPRSLIFNWKQEAERFTPQLRVLDYTGVARGTNNLAEYDVVLTTYGTLRRDVVRLKDVEFDYVVLDEAQAIKNADTEAAKAVRLLRGEHRLALSGTPIENHLGELWSLFEFLNPGMLGRASVFKLTTGKGRNPDAETRKLLAHALRPFILRRTKAQVAPELPAKTEQTIFCELESAQRRLYNELRQHYRESLLKRIDDGVGLAKSKIQVLEALLRLRQAACHPGLIDSKRKDEPSAKLDVLLDQLREVMEEGHKALVFSQFTSLLSIVRSRLEDEGILYEYLDGATRDRQERVERFQNDPECRLFLVSLKAGGLGLNLTAAEYVFLLDPWWNPAVEAQAIDRAHRIGQTEQVFAYRLIARDTVEEKVLELQNTKRDLASAIISEDNNLIRDLKREDLELLLS